MGICSTAALAQEGEESASPPAATVPAAAPIAATEAVSSANLPAAGLTYVPADFERFAPRNALDMLGQVPGFNIRGDDGERGLGQASANVVINGARISSKSDGIFDQLRQISLERVERIEIVDGASLGIPGLSGQVANVVTKPGAISGQFEYNATARPKYARPSFFGGEISLSGSGENHEWTLAYSHGVGRGAAAGGIANISDAQGNIIENRDVLIRFVGDFPQLSARGKWTSAGGTIVNANASYSRNYSNFSDDEFRDLVTGVDRFRDFDNRNRGWGYEIGGDVDFALGSGRMKLIALDSSFHGNVRQNSVVTFADGSPDSGNRYVARTNTGERIGRAEYSWAMLGGDWQVDAEAAFNRLDRTASLFDLDPSGEFVEIDFPSGSGGVTEDRYETIVTYSRPLTGRLSLQLGVGGEYSTLSQTGPGGQVRSFQRPKGSATLAWAAKDGLDISLKLAREVRQLSFGDFLASVSLNQNNQNDGNVELVPPQVWELDLEISKDLGAWGSTTLLLYGRWFEDLIEFIPVTGGFEARGNIPDARRYSIDWRTTLELSRIGWNGAKLDTAFVYNDTSLADPLTGIPRPFSGQSNINAEIDLRHDIPGSNWAWGAGLSYNHALPYYRLGEVGRDFEGPIYTYAFVEHKDVFGMTANLQVFNLTDGRARFERTVYDGFRGSSPVLFSEYRDQSVQPIFRFQLTGDF